LAQRSFVKVLLVGPFPPPHGGVSVHVLTLQDLLQKSGMSVRVLNIGRGAPASDKYVSVRSPLHFMLLLLRYSLKGWSLHVHINGHNAKSWLVAFVAGLLGMIGPGALLTIHSGMSPAYLRDRRSGRLLASATSKFYRHIVAVNSEIKDALSSLSVPAARIEILPAFLPTPAAVMELPENFESWSRVHDPVISTALFFRPEYCFGSLVQAISTVKEKHPRLGCVVMGDSESRPSGLPEHIFAIGDVTHDSCLAVIARSDIFVRATFSDGDAISVREAIALGTPVVASDVVSRPAGTVCFKTGDARDLALKMESVLSQVRAHSHVIPEPVTNGIHRLMELYSS
jgi:glycogen(starch) synthase